LVYDVEYLINGLKQKPDRGVEFSSIGELVGYYNNLNATLLSVVEVLYIRDVEPKNFPKVKYRSSFYHCYNDLNQYSFIRIPALKKNISPDALESFILENFEIDSKNIKKILMKK
jgi:hypothetical protein